VTIFFEVLAWVVAAAWVSRVWAAAWGLPRVADLWGAEFVGAAKDGPRLTVVVPARDEGGSVRACLESLVGQDYANLTVVAVDDRSMDGTGAILDAVAAEHPGRVRVIHVAELPGGWLGKTHAMALAAREVESEFVLFTDADVMFEPTALRRAMGYAVSAEADHLVLMPTTIIKRWDEAALLSFFQIFGLWATRPWKVADAKAKRDAIGVGAFNLVRRTAYDAVGGWEALRMEVVEDLALARRVKEVGLRQRVVFGKGLVRVHWASGVWGLVGVMTKNVFAATGFQPVVLLGGVGWLASFCILPFLGVWSWAYWFPSWIVVGSMAWAYRLMGRHSGLSAWNVLLAPFAAAVFAFTMLRSMVVTLWQGGVVWRGTFYALGDLRQSVEERQKR